MLKEDLIVKKEELVDILGNLTHIQEKYYSDVNTNKGWILLEAIKFLTNDYLDALEEYWSTKERE